MATAEVEREAEQDHATDLSADVMKEAEELIAEEEGCDAVAGTIGGGEYTLEVGEGDEPLPGSDGNFEGDPLKLEGSSASPSTSEAWEHDLLAEIRDLEKEVAIAESSWTAAKEVAKARKAFYEEQVTALRTKIRQADEKFPLFDKPKESPQAEKVDESWREVRLESLESIKPGTLNKLYEASLETVGDLTDWQSSGKELTDIPGIGKAKVDQISDALEEFWKDWNAGKRFNVASPEDEA